jgi:tetratricopeptide (TPR) repeat protein
MSLLLEALKKAERAKEEAQRKAREEGQARALSLEATAAAPPAADAKPVMTRDELPDIRQPLEILSDEITSKEPEAAPATALQSSLLLDRPAPAARPTTQQRPHAEASRQTEAQAADRATGKKVFEAKFKEPNPRLPFYIVMGCLSVFALGTGIYFWYQLRPPPSLVNTNPGKTGNEVAAAPTETKPGATAPAGAAAGPAAIPGLPGAPAAAAAPAPSAPTATATPAPAPKPAAVPRAPTFTTPPAPRQIEQPALAQTRLPPQVHPTVDSAYTAYLAGDLAAARADYQAALREDGGNRDALLGLAAIDVRTGRLESAEGTYLRLLQTDPNDAHAQAGLIALRSSRLDPLATESRVKTLLAADPGANVLHFTLGNQMAQQGRWAEAQQEYFKAFAADPDNADFAYNLAISLDHLRQFKLALEYYRRAIALAEKRGASFDVGAARTRVAQLGN